MSRIMTYVCAGFLLTFSISLAAAPKTGKIKRVSSSPIVELRPGITLSSADSCVVRQDGGLIWRIDGWVIGNELYKSFLDPAASCNLPYPFTIYEINMPMAFDAATPLVVSVDVEEADYTDPNCPVPGNLLAISAQYQLDVPAAGLYNVWVPLDSPITVNGPFFAGFFIGNTFTTTVNPGLVTDSIPLTCVSYNIWDTAFGYVDLVDNEIWNFPGRLVLYASGSTGGQGGTQPPPALTFLSPTSVDTLYGFTTLWAWDTSGSSIIDYVKFEARQGSGSYTEIGSDFDGTKTLRDGVNSAAIADGFSYFWDFSSRPEGTYTVRATAVDTSGRSSADSVVVFLEPTPPVPDIVSPAEGQNFCPNVQLLVSLFDENISKLDAYVKEADTLYSLNLMQLSQSSYGDANGNPLDGNSSSNGEFGNHYSGPVAATQAIRVWYDRGYRQFMRQGSSDIPINVFVESMAALFDTRTNRGTYDENIVSGLHQHLDKFGIVDIGFLRGPDYYDIRTWVEDEERSVMLGLSDNPGLWVAVDGFSGWKNSNNEFLVRIANPATGVIESCPVREISGNSEIQISGNWHSIDIMISIFVTFWGVNRQFIGTDIDGNNGWSINWTPSSLTGQSPVFFRAQGEDTDGFVGSSAILMRYDCANFFVKGDYNGDNSVNLQDLVFMIDFCLNGGPPPVGGVGRADANCDNNVNVTDAVYFMNYMFGSAGSPCY